MKKRLVALLILFVAIIFLPYWVYLPLLVAAILIFPVFWEGILLGLLIDVLYGWGVTAWPSLISPVALTALILVSVLLPVRDRLRFHV